MHTIKTIEGITRVGVSAGGVAPIPLFLSRSATFLTGKRIDSDTVRGAAEIAQDEISPISDARGSASYKRLLLRQLIHSHFLTLFPTELSLEVLV